MGRRSKSEASIESPWPDQVLILHDKIGGQASKGYTLAVRRAVKNNRNTHFVREVRVGYLSDYFLDQYPESHVGKYTKAFVDDCVGHAEEEFDFMRSIGLGVVPHEFRTVTDSQGRLRTLARVAIIDGQNFGYKIQPDQYYVPSLALQPIESELLDSISRYRCSAATRPDAHLLADINFLGTSDFVHGIPRGSEYADFSPQTYLVDIEPLFAKPRT